MEQTNLRKAVKLTALVLAAGLLIGLLTGCSQSQTGNSQPQTGTPSQPTEPETGTPSQPTDPSIFRTDGNGIITGYNCASHELPKNLVIPNKIGDEVIIGIDSVAFRGCRSLKTLDLSACTNLKSIGRTAFEECGFTSVIFPASLTRIDIFAFCCCYSLNSATFADKEGWAVYDDDGCTQNKTPIASSDLEAVGTAAQYLYNNYFNKYWKKN